MNKRIQPEHFDEVWVPDSIFEVLNKDSGFSELKDIMLRNCRTLPEGRPDTSRIPAQSTENAFRDIAMLRKNGAFIEFGNLSVKPLTLYRNALIATLCRDFYFSLPQTLNDRIDDTAVSFYILANGDDISTSDIQKIKEEGCAFTSVFIIENGMDMLEVFEFVKSMIQDVFEPYSALCRKETLGSSAETELPADKCFDLLAVSGVAAQAVKLLNCSFEDAVFKIPLKVLNAFIAGNRISSGRYALSRTEDAFVLEKICRNAAAQWWKNHYSGHRLKWEDELAKDKADYYSREVEYGGTQS